MDFREHPLPEGARCALDAIRAPLAILAFSRASARAFFKVDTIDKMRRALPTEK